MYEVEETFCDIQGGTESHRFRLTRPAIEIFEKGNFLSLAFAKWFAAADGMPPTTETFAPRDLLETDQPSPVTLLEFPDGNVAASVAHTRLGFQAGLSALIENPRLRRSYVGDVAEATEYKTAQYYHVYEVDEGQARHFSRLILPVAAQSGTVIVAALVIQNPRTPLVVVGERLRAANAL